MKEKAKLILTDGDTGVTNPLFQYLLGVQPSLGAIILHGDRAYLLIDGRYYESIKKSEKTIQKYIQKLGFKYGVIPYLIEKNIFETIKYLYKKHNIGQLYIEDILTLGQHAELKNQGLNIKIFSGKTFFQPERKIKKPFEVKNIKIAINIIENVFGEIFTQGKKGELQGKTEKEVQAIIQSKIQKLGGEKESFETIVAFGENSSIPHHKSGNTKVANGPLLIDMGCVYNGYCSDFTRCFWVGEKNNDYKEFIEIHNIVSNSYDIGVKNAQVGCDIRTIDALIRNYMRDVGYERYFIHSTGHGIGVQIHEGIKISEKSMTPEILEAGMVFTIEPGIYLPGKFGVRLENIVFTGKRKTNDISSFPIEKCI